MQVIDQLNAFLEGKACPATWDAGKLQKLAKKAQSLTGRKAVALYPVRDDFYDSYYYRVFACPLKESTLDEPTLKAICQDLADLDLGHIRYDAVSAGNVCVAVKDEHGRFSSRDGDLDAVQQISNRYDGVVLFTCSTENIHKLDCRTAVTGYDKYGLNVLTVTNKQVGQPETVVREFETVNRNGDGENDENIPKGLRVYNRLMRYVVYVLLALCIIYWLFLK